MINPELTWIWKDNAFSAVIPDDIFAEGANIFELRGLVAFRTMRPETSGIAKYRNRGGARKLVVAWAVACTAKRPLNPAMKQVAAMEIKRMAIFAGIQRVMVRII